MKSDNHPVRVAIYQRVSRSDQDLSLQDHGTRAFAAQRGWVVVRAYQDHGVSGAHDRRPALDQLLQDARRGRFDVVLAWKADRLFRSLKHLVVAVGDLAEMGGLVEHLLYKPVDPEMLRALVAAVG